MTAFLPLQAAQKGSTECLHWLLEQGVDASIQDGKTTLAIVTTETQKALYTQSCNI